MPLYCFVASGLTLEVHKIDKQIDIFQPHHIVSLKMCNIYVILLHSKVCGQNDEVIHTMRCSLITTKQLGKKIIT
jgi:hypothetical protein